MKAVFRAAFCLLPFCLHLSWLCACTPQEKGNQSQAGAAQPNAAAITPGETGRPSASGAPAEAPSPSPMNLPPPPPAPPEAKRAFVRGANALGTALYGELRKNVSGNLALSPLSISLALSMGQAGARGATAAEMAQVLGWQSETQGALASAGELVSAWSVKKTQGPRLELTQRLFGEQKADFRPEYLSTLQDVFGAPLVRVNFAGAPDESRVHINSWVADHTNQRIKNLLPPRSVDASTRLVLVNALFFLADWKQAFDKEKTVDAPFRISSTETVSVPTMNARAKFGYAYVGAAHLLDIPYQGGELSMTFILPWKGHKLEEVEASLAGSLAGWVSQLEEQTVRVALPRFELKGATFSLRAPLAALGMKSAFSSAADFSGIAPPNPEPLVLSDVLHQIYVKVDEAGTEAAAATALVMARSVSAGGGGGGFFFIADQPFLFAIRDRKSGSVLFLGRVNDPRPG